MQKKVLRREFIQLTFAGSALCLCGLSSLAFGSNSNRLKLISPGCRRTKVKVARIYMGTSSGLWPKPNLDFKKEIQIYESEFKKLKDELSDVEFVVDEMVTSPEQVSNIKSRLKDVDGILAIHFNIGINSILNEILSVGSLQWFSLFRIPDMNGLDSVVY